MPGQGSEHSASPTLTGTNADFKSEDVNLFFFYRSTCPFTKKVEPQLQCFESSTKLSVKRLETTSPKNYDLYEASGGIEYCGGVPFFYNSKTGSTVCGAQSCEVLKLWAKSTEKLHM
jgi:hypothetical protein